VGAFLGVNCKRVQRLAREEDGFPGPAIDRPGWYLWRRHEIERWARTTDYLIRDDRWTTKMVASHLGVTLQRVHTIYRDPQYNFPAPLTKRQTGFSWDPDAIKLWAHDHGYPKRRG
jgi:hypothetical protein